MGKYIGPKTKIIRRLGILPGLTQKNIKEKRKTPGEHGKILYTNQKRTSISEDYKQRLIEKQKVRFNYGLTEKQLYKYYKEAKKRSGSTGDFLLQLLESRLDCIIYRSGFAPTIPAARQLINHGHFLVNTKKVNIPSFCCKTNDSIMIRQKNSTKELIKKNLQMHDTTKDYILTKIKTNPTILEFFEPQHLSLDLENLKVKIVSLVKRNNILIKINELKVVEFYSR